MPLKSEISIITNTSLLLIAILSIILTIQAVYNIQRFCLTVIQEIVMDKINPKIGVEYVDDVVVITLLLEKILEQSDIQDLQDSIMPLVDQKPSVNMVIDFANVRFLSSSVLGLLIRISKRIYETAGELRLSTIDPKINEIFKITRLDKVFQILPDIDAAISDLK